MSEPLHFVFCVLKYSMRQLAAADLDPSKSEYLLHKAAAMCKLGTYSQVNVIHHTTFNTTTLIFQG